MTDPLERWEDPSRHGARRRGMPRWIPPMLATLTHEAFDDPDWIFERKFDGERVLAFHSPQGEVRLLSRGRNPLNTSYPEVEAGVREAPPRGCVVDGEVVSLDADGVSDFQRLQPRMQAQSADEAVESGVRVQYRVFDVPYVGGHDLRGCALRDRKLVLRDALDRHDVVRFTPHRNEQGREVYARACRRGREGVIANRADAGYASGRSRDWLKFKCAMGQEFVIGGYTEPRGEREGFGALLVGVHRDGELLPAGRVGTGFDERTLDELGRRLRRLRRRTSPFDREVDGGDDLHFVRPELVCEVGFTDWTDDGRLRHPRFRGLRRDKDPEDVVREDRARVPEALE